MLATLCTSDLKLAPKWESLSGCNSSGSSTCFRTKNGRDLTLLLLWESPWLLHLLLLQPRESQNSSLLPLSLFLLRSHLISYKITNNLIIQCRRHNNLWMQLARMPQEVDLTSSFASIWTHKNPESSLELWALLARPESKNDQFPHMMSIRDSLSLSLSLSLWFSAVAFHLVSFSPSFFLLI